MTGSWQPLVHWIGSGIDSEEVLGPRGAGLARAHDLGLRTPAGFTISLASPAEVHPSGSFSPALQAQVAEALSRLEHELEGRLDSPSRPIFLSVSGDVPPIARKRMLVGLAEPTLPALEDTVGPDAAGEIWISTLRRFAEEVRGIDPFRVGSAAAEGPDALMALIAEASGAAYPQAGADQLRETILARCLGSPRPTGVTVHRMPLPTGDDDPTDIGVAFTRDPATGLGKAFGGFPGGGFDRGGEGSSIFRVLSRRAPRALEELLAALPLIEVAYKRICALSFAVEEGRLTVVDVRPTRGSTLASGQMLVDLVEDHLVPVEEAITLAPFGISSSTGVLAVEPEHRLASGTGLCSGAVVAPIAIGEEGVRRTGGDGLRPLLVVDQASEASAEVLPSCAGLLIAAATDGEDAVVATARRLGIPVVAGVRQLAVSEMLAVLIFPEVTLREGESLALDGGSGMVATGEARHIPARSSRADTEILSWCRESPRVPIVPEPPEGWTTVADVDRFPSEESEGPILIDLAAAPEEGRAELLRAVASAPGQVKLGLRPPPLLIDTLPLPVAPWELIVAPDAELPGLQLLAAKLAILAGAKKVRSVGTDLL